MAADTPTADDKKKAPDTHGDNSAPAKVAAKDVAAGTASPEQVKKAVDTNVVADPAKLNSDTFSCSVGSKIDWSKPASTDLSCLYLDNSIYNKGTNDSKLTDPSKLSDFSKFTDSTRPIDLTKPTDLSNFQPSTTSGWDKSLSNYDLSNAPLNFTGDKWNSPNSWNKINTFNNADYASAFWTEDYTTKFNNAASTALTHAFDDPGDSAKTQGARTGMDAATTSELAAHKAGDKWSENGVDSYKTASGDLVQKDKDGIHLQSTDGLKIDAKGKNDLTMSKNGDTIVKKGDDYFKKYPDGSEVQIKDKGDIADIVKAEGIFVEQRHAALAALGHDRMAEERNRRQNHIEQGPNDVQIFKVDKAGDLIAKSGNESGTRVQTSDGHDYFIKDGKIYKHDGDKLGDEVPKGQIPSSIKDNGDGTFTIGTVTVDKNNKFSDAESHSHMDDKTKRVDVDTAKGPMTVSVDEQGKEQVKTPDKTYNFDPNDGPQGRLQVLNPDNTKDLDFNFNTHVLDTDGLQCGPDGVHFGDEFLDWNGSFFDGDNQVFSAAYDADDYGSSSSSTSYESQAKAVADDVTEDAASDVSGVSGELSNFTSDFSDVAGLKEDLSSLTTAQGLHLSDSDRSKLNAQIASVSAALDVATKQAEASALSLTMTGMQNSELTKEISESGGSAQAAQVVMRRWGLLPQLELFDSSAA